MWQSLLIYILLFIIVYLLLCYILLFITVYLLLYYILLFSLFQVPQAYWKKSVQQTDTISRLRGVILGRGRGVQRWCYSPFRLPPPPFKISLASDVPLPPAQNLKKGGWKGKIEGNGRKKRGKLTEYNVHDPNGHRWGTQGLLERSLSNNQKGTLSRLSLCWKLGDRKVIRMELALDGISEHVVHGWMYFWRKKYIVVVVIKCLRQIKSPLKCAHRALIYYMYNGKKNLKILFYLICSVGLSK